jgi:hypothetical protein
MSDKKISYIKSNGQRYSITTILIKTGSLWPDGELRIPAECLESVISSHLKDGGYKMNLKYALRTVNNFISYKKESV